MNNFDLNARLSLVLSGATLDTGNLGVSALCASVISGLASSCPTVSVTLLDFGRGDGCIEYESGGNRVTVRRCGAYHTMRFYRTESLLNIRFCAFFGGLWNPSARSVLSANAILDISGGDSFTDMYGPKRFRAVTVPKLMAIERRKALILLPQTYGPFQDIRSRKTAQKIVRSCRMAWARDERSFEVLRDLLGNAFDPNRHRVGVDVAFRLPVTRPDEDTVARKIEWFNEKSIPLVGLNVSGLLHNRPKIAAKQYGLKADYKEVILLFLRRLLKNSEVRVLLIPHVVTPLGHYESDIEACESIWTALGEEHVERVAISPVVNDPSEAKWIIAQCDWFCGTRMHSTIAALSSGVPTAAISYSPKTLGVFESCGQGAHVADPCRLDTGKVVGQLWQSWLDRAEAGRTLQASLPAVLNQAEEQLNMVVSACVENLK